jgi:hypothetical protein
MLRGRIGSFADQVYPILALAYFAEAFDDEGALAAARTCARAICEVQGPLGQWWWHYDAKSGRVVQRYPVYSVHQHAMAPMALLALGRSTGWDFNEPILKGLRWITGANELGQDMRDRSFGLVWRCVRFASRSSLIRQEVGFWFRADVQTPPSSDLAVLRECRPYELGWLLYALAAHATASGPTNC